MFQNIPYTNSILDLKKKKKGGTPFPWCRAW